MHCGQTKSNAVFQRGSEKLTFWSHKFTLQYPHACLPIYVFACTQIHKLCCYKLTLFPVPYKNSPLATDLVSPLPATCKTWREESKYIAKRQTDAKIQQNVPAKLPYHSHRQFQSSKHLLYCTSISDLALPPIQTLESIQIPLGRAAHLAFPDITALHG